MEIITKHKIDIVLHTHVAISLVNMVCGNPRVFIKHTMCTWCKKSVFVVYTRRECIRMTETDHNRQN